MSGWIRGKLWRARDDAENRDTPLAANSRRARESEAPIVRRSVPRRRSYHESAGAAAEPGRRVHEPDAVVQGQAGQEAHRPIARALRDCAGWRAGARERPEPAAVAT